MRSTVGLPRIFPIGIIAMVKVDSAGQIGQLVRRRRKEAGMTLKDAAALAGVGVRFLSELERGKPTLQLGLAISVLQLFGLELHVEQRGDQRG
jgi:HTH-type transcriptional regulator/antitoxin HipB